MVIKLVILKVATGGAAWVTGVGGVPDVELSPLFELLLQLIAMAAISNNENNCFMIFLFEVKNCCLSSE